MLKKKILTEIEDVTDEFYPALAMLRQYKDEEDTPLGFLMCVTVRAKIYANTKELLRRYKKGQDYDYFLGRIFHQLKLHRFQIKKLNKTNPSTDYQNVHRFCVALVALLYIAFSDKTT